MPHCSTTLPSHIMPHSTIPYFMVLAASSLHTMFHLPYVAAAFALLMHTGVCWCILANSESWCTLVYESVVHASASCLLLVRPCACLCVLVHIGASQIHGASWCMPDHGRYMRVHPDVICGRIAASLVCHDSLLLQPLQAVITRPTTREET